jgi:hypothetical protein
MRKKGSNVVPQKTGPAGEPMPARRKRTSMLKGQENKKTVVVDVPKVAASGTQTSVTIIGTPHDGKQGILKTPVGSLERMVEYEVETQPDGVCITLAGKNMILRKSRKKSTISMPTPVQVTGITKAAAAPAAPVVAAKTPRKRSVLSQQSLSLGAPIRQPDTLVGSAPPGEKADLSANEEFTAIMKNKGAARKRSTYRGAATAPSQAPASPIKQVPGAVEATDAYNSFTRTQAAVRAPVDTMNVGSEAHDIEVFETFDTNGSGAVPMDELVEILNAAGWSPSFSGIASQLEALGLSAAASTISRDDFCRLTRLFANPGQPEPQNGRSVSGFDEARGETKSAVVEQKRSVYDRVEAQHHIHVASVAPRPGAFANSSKKQLMSVSKQREEQKHVGFGLQGGHGGHSAADSKKGNRWSLEYEEHASHMAEAAVKAGVDSGQVI